MVSHISWYALTESSWSSMVFLRVRLPSFKRVRRFPYSTVISRDAASCSNAEVSVNSPASAPSARTVNVPDRAMERDSTPDKSQYVPFIFLSPPF